MTKFVNATQGKNHSVIYTDTEGARYIYSGGTWTWRNHNPGNLRLGGKNSVVRQFDWIGTAGGFVVFPDREIGRQAMIALLRTHTYQKKNIYMLVKSYAPPEDNNNVDVYVKLLQKHTGVYDNRIIKDFTHVEFLALCEGIEKMEGYHEGSITPVHKVLNVKENTSGIYLFNIEKLGWLPKGECITLTKTGIIDAVLCRSKSGALYLRSRPHISAGQGFHDRVVKEK